MLKIKDIKEHATIRWNVIPLEIDFAIPSFHRTAATSNGNIYVIGGTFPTMEKSKNIYYYEPLHKTLKKVSELSVGRSSHSIVCVDRKIYVVGGMI